MIQTSEYNMLTNLCIPTMLSILKEYFAPDNIFSMNASLNLSEGQLANFAQEVLFEELIYDISNLADNDPAAKNVNDNVKYVLDSYKGLKAIIYYRIANHLLDFNHNCLMTDSSLDSEEDVRIIQEYMKLQARKISERAATETTIEINPAAQIGKGFVIDHGVGTKVATDIQPFSTVIGETCVIGDNCTLLNGVLLGASVINNAKDGVEGVSTGKRHPTLGNHVTVCAGARILGNIRIGDNVTIGPCCVITADIPDDYNVTIVNQLQYSRPDARLSGKSLAQNKFSLYGLAEDNLRLILFGYNLMNCDLSIVKSNQDIGLEENECIITIMERSNTKISFTIDSKNVHNKTLYSLKVKTETCEYILFAPQALNRYLRKEGNK